MKKKLMVTTLVALSSLCFSTGGLAQAKEIRVLLANHPYGELLKSVIPEFEKASGIKVNFESLQESQLTQKLTTEFATKSSSVDVFMTRPLQEGKMFSKNGWYETIASYDFSDYPKSIMGIASSGGKPYLVPLVTEWQVLYYRKDLFNAAGVKVPVNFTELEAAAQKLNSDDVAGFASRGKGAASVTQLSSYVYNFGGGYLDKGVAVFDSQPAVDAIRYYGKLLGNYGPKGVTSMSWENIMPLFQAGKIAMWTDASVFYGQVVDPAKTQVPAENVGIANFPAGPKTNSPFIVVSWGMAIANQSKNKELAAKFLEWATSQELAKRGMLSNITMARISAWQDKDVLAKVNPGLVETQVFAAQNGNPFDRPYMSAVGEARDLIGEVVIEAINTKGASPNLESMAKERAVKVNDLLKDAGEYGKE
ncbi:MAG: sugar ABC transporter substrate-binding protein [Candidatus Accumulibacter sp.]|jgi:multiple sugar transport system substrate-binding protein|nr:sugar ABC transporter substrate-binding protein [Accumulibacter sp.]